ncbi:MAG TPA: glycosyltransferase [Burkholderiales bacterium]|nr:glycosyltransferase [Burkholderiales bacterium]
MTPGVAVLIPCFNEAAAIGAVVRAFRAALPGAQVYVFDNNSTDDSRRLAAEAGAIVRAEARQGKGNVVRRMFADVDADVYLLVDGDGTYDAPSAPRLIETLLEGGCDMVTGVRKAAGTGSYRPGHVFGNRLLTAIVGRVFGRRIGDLLSGYRALSRRFVKSFPALSSGFEIETELSVHALELGIPFAEVETPYYARPGGSESKLGTWRDGWRILLTILKLVKGERPLAFFSAIAAAAAAPALLIGAQLWITFVETGLVPRFPSAILATGLMLTAFLSLVCGLVLDTVTRGRQEMKRLAYLGQAASRVPR